MEPRAHGVGMATPADAVDLRAAEAAQLRAEPQSGSNPKISTADTAAAHVGSGEAVAGEVDAHDVHTGEVSGPVEADAQIDRQKSRDACGLGELETRMLDFERKWWRYAGAKEQAVGELFGVSSTRYYQMLNTLIDSPAALAYDPMLVKRLRRMRQTRQRARSARRSGVQ